MSQSVWLDRDGGGTPWVWSQNTSGASVHQFCVLGQGGKVAVIEAFKAVQGRASLIPEVTVDADDLRHAAALVNTANLLSFSFRKDGVTSSTVPLPFKAGDVKTSDLYSLQKVHEELLKRLTATATWFLRLLPGSRFCAEWEQETWLTLSDTSRLGCKPVVEPLPLANGTPMYYVGVPGGVTVDQTPVLSVPWILHATDVMLDRAFLVAFNLAAANASTSAMRSLPSRAIAAGLAAWDRVATLMPPKTHQLCQATFLTSGEHVGEPGHHDFKITGGTPDVLFCDLKQKSPSNIVCVRAVWVGAHTNNKDDVIDATAMRALAQKRVRDAYCVVVVVPHVDGEPLTVDVVKVKRNPNMSKQTVDDAVVFHFFGQ